VSLAKGNRFERELAEKWQTAGFDVRGLEQGGDHFIVALNGHVLHSEAKRQEVLRIPLWIRQVEADCAAGLPWVLGFRQSRRPAYGVQLYDHIVEREAQLAALLGGGS
jgi:hypothetical protein